MVDNSKQLAIFDETAPMDSFPAIPGLYYFPDFIDRQAESTLVDTIDIQPWIADLKRRVQHYGYRYDYKARNVTVDLKLGDIPEWLMTICQKLKSSGLFENAPDQVIINEYQPGQGIAAHTDCVPCFGNTIASISLGSPCVMDFSHAATSEKFSILLEPRSLVVLSDGVRYCWRHGIAHRKVDRYQGNIIRRNRRLSLTFRNVITNESVRNLQPTHI